jgi:hypothetical protein
MVSGDEVDYSKISIIAGCIPTKKIIVHKDGRVFLLKSYVCASNVDKINVYVDQDQIKFD